MKNLLAYKLESEWCTQCKTYTPILKEVERETGILFVRCDVDSEKGKKEAKEHGITSLPALIFMDTSFKYLDKLVGLKSKEEVIEKINELKGEL